MVDGQKIDHGHDTREFFPWSMVKMEILSSISLSNFRLIILTAGNFDFDNGNGQNLDYLTSDIFGYGHGLISPWPLTVQFSLYLWSNGWIDHRKF